MSFLQPNRLYANFGLSWLNSFGKIKVVFLLSPLAKRRGPLSKNIWCQVWLKMAQ